MFKRWWESCICGLNIKRNGLLVEGWGGLPHQAQLTTTFQLASPPQESEPECGVHRDERRFDNLTCGWKDGSFASSFCFYLAPSHCSWVSPREEHWWSSISRVQVPFCQGSERCSFGHGGGLCNLTHVDWRAPSIPYILKSSENPDLPNPVRVTCSCLVVLDLQTVGI